MADLGDYALHVTAAYSVTLVLLAALIAVSVLRSYRLGRDLERLENRQPSKSDG